MSMIGNAIAIVRRNWQAYATINLIYYGLYVSGNAFLRPRSVGLTTHGGGYFNGLKQTASLYVLVTLLLAVAAVYEALEVIYIVPLFR